MTDNTPTTKQEEGGLVTVPREPTDAMLMAGCDLWLGDGNRSHDWEKRLRETWSAFLSAAPATPPHNEDGVRKLAERLHQAADDIVSGETIFSDRVHGLLWEAADALCRQALGDIPSG